MAHFAQLDSDSTVLRVLVVPTDREHRGEAFLRDDLGLGGRWVQTSYNNTDGRRFAGIGMTYSEALDMFIAPQPYASWTLDAAGDWQAPTPYPTDGQAYEWDEPTLSWVLAE